MTSQNLQINQVDGQIWQMSKKIIGYFRNCLNCERKKIGGKDRHTSWLRKYSMVQRRSKTQSLSLRYYDLIRPDSNL